MAYTLYDNSIHDGTKCTDYRKLSSSYATCVEDDVQQKFVNWYGCVPKWFPGEMSKCSMSHKPLTIEPQDFMSNLTTHRDIITDCKPSCLRLDLKLQKVDEFSNFPSYAVLELMHEHYFEVGLLYIIHRLTNEE